MFVFAHLRKCAGTSVVKAVIKAGVKVPPKHCNAHPAGDDGHALPGMAEMDKGKIADIFSSLAEAGTDFVALEWDFPRFEKFPDRDDLRFFAIFRDPVQRLYSNYTFDVTNGYTRSRSLSEYMLEPGIWAHENYYTRFFAGMKSFEAVTAEHEAYVAEVVTRRFKFAFFEDDLLAFVKQEVGVPVRVLPKSNRTSSLRKRLMRLRTQLSDEEIHALRALNAADYRLMDALKAHREAPADDRRLRAG